MNGAGARSLQAAREQDEHVAINLVFVPSPPILANTQNKPMEGSADDECSSENTNNLRPAHSRNPFSSNQIDNSCSSNR